MEKLTGKQFNRDRNLSEFNDFVTNNKIGYLINKDIFAKQT